MKIKKMMIAFYFVWLFMLNIAVEAKSPQQLSSEAYKSLAAWQAGAAVAGSKGLPRLSDPVDSLLIRAVFDLDTLNGMAPVTVADVPYLLDACDSAKAVLKSYIFWSKDGLAPNTAANEVTFTPEIVLGGTYTTVCLGDEAEAVQMFLATLPPDQLTEVRKQGVEQARLGMFQMVLGLSQMIAQKTYSNEQKLMLAHALQDATPKFAALWAKEDRAGLLKSLSMASAAVTNPALKAELEIAISKINAVE
jgi:hypothetical protein